MYVHACNRICFLLVSIVCCLLDAFPRFHRVPLPNYTQLCVSLFSLSLSLSLFLSRARTLSLYLSLSLSLRVSFHIFPSSTKQHRAFSRFPVPFDYPIVKTEQQWRTQLSKEEYNVHSSTFLPFWVLPSFVVCGCRLFVKRGQSPHSVESLPFPSFPSFLCFPSLQCCARACTHTHTHTHAHTQGMTSFHRLRVILSAELVITRSTLLKANLKAVVDGLHSTAAIMVCFEQHLFLNSFKMSLSDAQEQS